ncbi:class I adenylate-forming enzyme family protein [Nocardia sp. NPDC052278]|uniref:class I adenylate-forming enzyme family protein n=1 Tax=unclassified Nocardia TaxID=2637762 RepID=UPI0036AFC9EF
MDFSERLRRVVRLDPAATAIHADEKWDTWADITAMGDSLDKVLKDLPDDAAIGLLAANDAAVIEALLALFMAGRAVVTFDPMQPATVLAEEIAELRPVAVIGVSAHIAGLAEGPDLAAAGVRVLTAVRGPGAHIDTSRDAEPGANCCVLPTGTAISLKTSGTTGPPKRIELGYSNLSASLDAVTRHHGGGASSDEVALRPGVTIQTLALAHTSALQSVLTAVCGGRRLALLPRFEPMAWGRAVRDHGVVTTGLPPAAIQMVLDAEVPKEWLSSLKAVRAGSAPLSTGTALAFEDRYGVPVLQAYGATEFQGLASWTLRDHRTLRNAKAGAVGRIHPGVEVRVVSEKDDSILPVGEAGVLEVRTAQAAKGRVGEWIRTSDLARTDEDGFLWILGRVDGAINRGGFKIDRAEVVETLLDHPAVTDAAVVPAPDVRLGQVPVAVVESGPATATRPTESELRDWVRNRLEAYKVPVQIAVVDRIPLGPAMKPDRQAILRLLGRNDHQPT